MMNFPPETATEARRHELLADVAEHIAQRLIEKHGVEEAAFDVGNSLADFLADHWKGQDIYMPGDQAFKPNARLGDLSPIRARNSDELAREHGISKVRVHQIYKRCLVEYRARTQNSLFSDTTVASDNAQP